MLKEITKVIGKQAANGLQDESMQDDAMISYDLLRRRRTTAAAWTSFWCKLNRGRLSVRRLFYNCLCARYFPLRLLGSDNRGRWREVSLLNPQDFHDFCGMYELLWSGMLVFDGNKPWCDIVSHPLTLLFSVNHLRCIVWALHRFQSGSDSSFQSISVSSLTLRESTLFDSQKIIS